MDFVPQETRLTKSRKLFTEVKTTFKSSSLQNINMK